MQAKSEENSRRLTHFIAERRFDNAVYKLYNKKQNKTRHTPEVIAIRSDYDCALLQLPVFRNRRSGVIFVRS
jgi:hypothetical protein